VVRGAGASAQRVIKGPSGSQEFAFGAQIIQTREVKILAVILRMEETHTEPLTPSGIQYIVLK
jgi:hypothetical protein